MIFVQDPLAVGCEWPNLLGEAEVLAQGPLAQGPQGSFIWDLVRDPTDYLGPPVYSAVESMTFYDFDNHHDDFINFVSKSTNPDHSEVLMILCYANIEVRNIKKWLEK